MATKATKTKFTLDQTAVRCTCGSAMIRQGEKVKHPNVTGTDCPNNNKFFTAPAVYLEEING